jgi:hypothetical protein
MHGFGEMAQPVLLKAKREFLIKAVVEKLVAEGFPTEAEIIEIATNSLIDELKEEQLVEDITKVTREALRYHLRIQESWPAVTDCDRIDKAFASLESQGLMATQNFAPHPENGTAEIVALAKAEQDNRPLEGFVFYEVEDTTNAVENNELNISFGALGDSATATIAVAQKIVTALKAEGLEVEWDGQPNDRICLPKIDWKRRRQEEQS